MSKAESKDATKSGLNVLDEEPDLVFPISVGFVPDELEFKGARVELNLKDEALMLNANWVPEEEVAQLWKQKFRLDHVFDSGQSRVYYDVRSRATKGVDDHGGGGEFWNRAGDKLDEIERLVPFLPKQEEFVFLDICGGPGAWSQMVFRHREKCSGFGMTLKSDEKSTQWYDKLVGDRRWKPVYGTTKNGDVYVPDNIDAVLAALRRPDQKPSDLHDSLKEVPFVCHDRDNILLIVGDGGFRVATDKDGNHLEHLQEMFSVRLLLSEFLAAFRGLSSGGNFVCKMFDVFSDATNTLIYLSALIFKNVDIVKPGHSRGVNSERYIVCTNMTDDVEKRSKVTKVLAKAHEHAFRNEKELSMPLIPTDVLHGDPLFVSNMSKMISQISTRQIVYLKHIMDEVDKELKNPTSRGKGGKGKGGKEKGGKGKGQNHSFTTKRNREGGGGRDGDRDYRRNDKRDDTRDSASDRKRRYPESEPSGKLSFKAPKVEDNKEPDFDVVEAWDFS